MPCCAASEIVSSESSPNTANIVFEVSDTGRGIAIHDQQRIFESFVRVAPSDKSQDFGPGLGLGLPITAALIQQMGGSVDLESQLQQGTTIRFTLSLRIVDNNPTGETEHTNAPKRNRSRKGGLRVLIVDDSRINRILMKEFLRTMHCRLKTAASLESAREIIARSTPDIVLLDRHLPDGDGLCFARGFQETGIRVPVIFLVTADIHFEAKDLLPSDPIVGVLHKPLELHGLQQALAPYSSVSMKPELATSATLETREFDTLKSHLLAALRSRLPEEINELRRHVEVNDFRMIQLVAHRLKGSSANVDWDSLTQCASRLEEAAEAKQVHDVRTAYEQLAKVVDRD